MTNDTTGRPSTTSLIADAIAQLGRLVETEVRLVKTELSEKISDAVRAVIMLVVSAVLLIAALVMILQGLVDLLVFLGLQPFVAAFAVGVAIAAVGGIVIFIALRRLSAEHMVPKRVIHQLGKDVDAIKDQVS